MKRKMLISIALIIIMLLNCILPIFSVNAATGEEIQLNSKLYEAVKKSLTAQSVKFSSDNVTHTITIASEVLNSVTRLDLNNSGISKLDGIEKFTALTSLELSGNDLDKDSLAPLSSLTNLTHLDLSTNKIEDVSAIKSLVDSLKGVKGGIVLSGQSVDIVQSAMVDDEEDSDNSTTADFELPTILEYAGYIKSNWKTISVTPQEWGEQAPELDITKVPMYITSETKSVPVTIYSDSYGGYYGLVKLTIYIYDDEHEASLASNKNPAASNLLNGSKFNLYFVVYPKSAEAITTMDSSLYEAIKEQLTAGQEINSQLSSYPYAMDINGDIIYELYSYRQHSANEDYYILSKFNEENPSDTSNTKYVLNKKTNTLYESTDGKIDTNKKVDIKFEKSVARFIDDQTGEIMEYSVYKVASKGADTGYKTGETLYVQAYDDAKTFVIKDSVLTNQITSLVLNNRRIKDLSGIEYFIGLSSNLNISHNFLEDIEPLVNLQTQKDSWEQQLKEQYNKWLKNRDAGNLSSSMSSIKTEYDSIKENIASIKDAYKQYQESMGGKEPNVEQITETYNKAVWGYEDDKGKKVEGFVDKIKSSIKIINNDINSSYSYLWSLYNIYSDEYKLTSLLADDINYTTYEEYKTYLSKTTETTEGATKETAKSLFSSQISRIQTLETANALSGLDKQLLEAAKKDMSVFFEEKEDSKTPISDYYSEYLKKVELNRTGYVNNIKVFREISLYSEMANYCLLKRMNEGVPTSTYCYEEEYLEKRIKELEEDYIPADLEREILSALQEGKTYDSKYFEIYKKYEASKADGKNEMINMGMGPYLDVYKQDENGNTYYISGALTLSSSLDGVISGIISTVDLYENALITYDPKTVVTSDANNLDLYNQLVSISNKLVNGNVDKYLKLPNLKVLDISYNADLEDIANVAKLENLRELNASYCYIADVANVDWSSMKYLRRLSLAYNFISDITPILSIPELKYLDLSNNLISGKIPITEQQYETLFKELETLNLSGNQITDIESLLIYIDHISGGNYSNYLAREDTLNIDLSNQYIDIYVDEPIYLSDYPTTVNIELPKIFTQLLALDAARTGFGETSQNGRIESEGSYVTLNTRTTGEKEGKVVVLPMGGNGETYDTCLGNGTTATIRYTVTNRVANGISITPESATAKNGDSVQFEAEVSGENLEDTSVVWTIEGNQSENTKIDENGLLVIGQDEKSDKITVIATSNFDSKCTISVEVKLPDNSTTDPDTNTTPDPDPDTNTTPDPDPDTNTTPDPDPDTNTTPDPDPDTNTTPDPDPDTNTTPDPDPDTNTTPDPTPSEVINTKELGYDVDEEFMSGIKAKTPIDDFKEILLNGKKYNVVVTKDGKEVTTGYMSTGMYVKVQDDNGNEVKDQDGNLLVYQIVVKGDVNSDGLANALDSNIIKAYRADVLELNGAEEKAADINSDGNINITDSKLLLYHRAEVKDYDLNYSK